MEDYSNALDLDLDFDDDEDIEDDEDEANCTSAAVQSLDDNADGLDEEEKKRRRLAKNRLSARESRRRKKLRREELLQQIAHFEAENLKLRLKLKIGNESRKAEVGEANSMTSKLDVMVREGACDIDIHAAISEMQERFSDYGRDRNSSIQFHLAQLRNCLRPTQTTRTMIWFMQIAPLFLNIDGTSCTVPAEISEDLRELWDSLLEAIKPSMEQRRTIVAFTQVGVDPIPDLQKISDDSLALIDRLLELVLARNKSLDTEMEEVAKILSPTQIAKFILWIDQNPACIGMLETLWPHIQQNFDNL